VSAQLSKLGHIDSYLITIFRLGTTGNFFIIQVFQDFIVNRLSGSSWRMVKVLWHRLTGLTQYYVLVKNFVLLLSITRSLLRYIVLKSLKIFHGGSFDHNNDRWWATSRGRLLITIIDN
jgi:hypothetical protein